VTALAGLLGRGDLGRLLGHLGQAGEIGRLLRIPGGRKADPVPRLMAVSLTEPQVRVRAKTVTRRTGWRMLRVGDQLTLCRKVMGRRRGEPLERIAAVEVTSVRRERLDAITAVDVAAEGFPEMTAAEFVAFFCRTHRGCGPGTEITRIQWRYLD
jgi:hypothetical protein